MNSIAQEFRQALQAWLSLLQTPRASMKNLQAGKQKAGDFSVKNWKISILGFAGHKHCLCHDDSLQLLQDSKAIDEI